MLINSKSPKICCLNNFFQILGVLGVIYRHPKQKLSLFQDKLCKNLSKLENNKLNCIVNGDFNINTLAIKNPKVSNYANDLNSIGCKMLINIPTRFAKNCKSS